MVGSRRSKADALAINARPALMNVYSKYVLPRTIGPGMSHAGTRILRAPWIPQASREVFVLTVFCLAIYSQDKPNAITVGRNIPIVQRTGADIYLEPHLAIDPANHQHLALGAISIQSSVPSVIAFHSNDGGQLWHSAALPGTDRKAAFDPWLAFGPSGDIYMAALIGAADIVVHRSSDGGQNWLPGVAVPRGTGGAFDHPAIAVDRTNGRFARTVYVVASQSARSPTGKKVYPTSIMRSVDEGKTYSPPVQVLPNNFNNENGNPVVLNDGTLVVPFFEITVNGKWLEHPRLWVVTSEDGGASFSSPYLVTQHFSGHSFSVLACSRDHSPNRLYLVWASKEASGGENVFLSNSSDKGETWSVPVRVNESAGQANTAARIPTIAVTDAGTVGVTWIDRRAAPTSKCSSVFFAASRDGGQTFLPNVRISEAQTCSDATGNHVPFGDGKTTVGERWEAGGDYSGLVAAHGIFHAVWADTRSGSYQLWHTTIRVEE